MTSCAFSITRSWSQCCQGSSGLKKKEHAGRKKARHSTNGNNTQRMLSLAHHQGASYQSSTRRRKTHRAEAEAFHCCSAHVAQVTFVLPDELHDV